MRIRFSEILGRHPKSATVSFSEGWTRENLAGSHVSETLDRWRKELR